MIPSKELLGLTTLQVYRRLFAELNIAPKAQNNVVAHLTATPTVDRIDLNVKNGPELRALWRIMKTNQFITDIMSLYEKECASVQQPG